MSTRSAGLNGPLSRFVADRYPGTERAIVPMALHVAALNLGATILLGLGVTSSGVLAGMFFAISASFVHAALRVQSHSVLASVALLLGAAIPAAPTLFYLIVMFS